MTSTREHQAPLKIIGLGLGRTGTFSLCTALEILGFGPCHHPVLLGVESDFWGRIVKAAKDDASPEVLDDLFRGYAVAMDSTAAVLAEPLYRAYPEAKFILVNFLYALITLKIANLLFQTTRDPAKWAQSINKTIINFYIKNEELQSRIASATASNSDIILYKKMKELGIGYCSSMQTDRYHQGRLGTDPEGELERHNKSIIQLIPPEKLLIFNVAEGWKPLVKFLGVPEPNQPFPNLNDPVDFEKRNKSLEEFKEP
ncbi:hypothetical protein Clacol_003413 [Clathrus columnatus]|uniref:Sulfotransferase family protein n=1 Tax=Clathrus columnatus TaxID=1419009 RepID=A0AAV5A852_9AGAM|nr:hypothetical protein Clacol_003413 [Clathrus columnatus]